MSTPPNSSNPSKEEAAILKAAENIYFGVYSLIALGWWDYSRFILFGFDAESLAKEREKQPSSQFVAEMMVELSQIREALDQMLAQTKDENRRKELLKAKSWAVKTNSALEALKPVVDMWRNPKFVAQWKSYQEGGNPTDSNGHPLFNCRRTDEWPGESLADRCIECVEAIYSNVNHGIPLSILF